MSENDQRDEPVWPDPQDDPDEEPSHPGARLDELEERLATEQERDGADT